MVKVTLINVRISNTVFMPLGLLYLASVLENNGFRVQVLDPFVDEIEEKIVQSISSFNPKYIGFSIVTPCFRKTRELKNKLVAFFPDKIYFAGGIHPTILPEETLTGLDLDFLVKGEGEYSLLETLRKLEENSSLDTIKGIVFKDKNGKIMNSPEQELINEIDQLPFPARNLLDIEKYFIPPGYIRSYFLDRVVNVLTSRGCPMSCVFCCSHILFGRTVRRRNVENIMQEIDLLINDYKINGLYFSDETFTSDHEWVYSFCKEIKKRRMPWGCATRIDFVNEALLRQMKSAGCIQTDIGVESGSNRILKIIKKNTTSDKIKATFSALKKNKIRTFATLMVGNPQETYSDIMETRKLLKIIKPSFTLISWFTPFPGTESYEWMLKNKNSNADRLKNNFDFVTSDRPLVNITNMNMHELISARSLLQRTVFFRNYFSMITIHNLKYITEALLYALLSPLGLLKALSISIKSNSFDYFTYFVFYNYEKFKMCSKCDSDS